MYFSAIPSVELASAEGTTGGYSVHAEWPARWA